MAEFDQVITETYDGASTTGTFTLNPGSNRLVFAVCETRFDRGGSFELEPYIVEYGNQVFKRVAHIFKNESGSISLEGLTLFMWHENWGAFTDIDYTITSWVGSSFTSKSISLLQFNDINDANFYFDGINTANSGFAGVGGDTSPNCPITPQHDNTLAVQFSINGSDGGYHDTHTPASGWTERHETTTGTYCMDRITAKGVETANAFYTADVRTDIEFASITLGLVDSNTIIGGSGGGANKIHPRKNIESAGNINYI